jgi:hypothetical protein
MTWFAEDACLNYHYNYFNYEGQQYGVQSRTSRSLLLCSPSETSWLPDIFSYSAGSDNWQNSTNYYNAIVADPIYGRVASMRLRYLPTNFIGIQTQHSPAREYDPDATSPAQTIINSGGYLSPFKHMMSVSATGLSGGGHYDSANMAVIWFGASSTDITATVHRVGGTIDASNVTEDNFLGFSSAAYNDGDTALILTIGAVETSHTGMTPATKMWVKADGTLAETAQEIPAFAGTALTATKLLVRA